MKNLKKLVSGIMTAAMLLSTAATGFAAAKGDCTTQKWLIDHYGSPVEGFVENENFYTEPTADVAYEGKFSMHFYSEATGGYVTRIRDKQTITAGTYYVSFYLKGNVTEGWTKAGLSKNLSMIATNGVWTKTVDGDWTKYEAELTTTADSDGVYMTVNGGADFYLDNFEVCPVTDGVKGANILSNGDFENSTQTLPEVPEEPTITATPDEDYITDVWEKQYVAIPEKYTPNKTVFAEPSTEESFDGEFSMHMVHPDTEPKGYVRIFERRTIEAGTYNVSFYLKGTVAEGWTAVGLVGAVGIGSFTKSDAGNGWTKYEKEITTTSNGDRAYFRVYGGGDFYIDNLEVCPVVNGVKGENILSNGGFEKTRKSAAGLINPIVYPTADGNAVLSWRNPNYANNAVIDSVEAILNGGGYEDYELDFSINTTTGTGTNVNRTNVCLIQGLTKDTDYVLTLNTKITQNDITTQYTKDIPFRTSAETSYGTISEKSAGKWILAKTQTASAYMNTVPAVDTDVKYSGNSSLRLDANMFSRVGNIYAPVAQTVTLERNKIYKLTFKAKLSGVNQMKAMVNAKSVEEIDGSVRSWAKQDYLEQNTSAYIYNDWTDYEYILSVDGDYPLFSESVETADEIRTTITIFPEQMCGSMWIDEVGLYEIDSDDEICSGNLLKDGGMEFVSSEITTSFKDADGKEIESIKAGTVNVTSGIRNVSLGNNFTAATIIALYNGNKLCNVWTKEGKVAEVADGIPAPTWTQEVQIPDDGGEYTIKVMYWNSSSEMAPIEALEELK